jgi:trans-aconitate methyltransferase
LTSQPSQASLDSNAFDQFAESYDEALNQGLALSGEGKEFFAIRRVEWVAECLQKIAFRPASVLDFGCGTGTSVPLLFDHLEADRVIGVDVSERSVKAASRAYTTPGLSFATLDSYRPDNSCDLAFCNGVFHHIPLSERRSAVEYVYRSLRAGGLFAFWENNPWNPGTRLVMSRIPFDRDAITLTPPEARHLLAESGFEVLQTDFLFLFPKSLRFLRFLETWFTPFPLGAQYMVLARRPEIPAPPGRNADVR